jgi:hypothetical protein
MLFRLLRRFDFDDPVFPSGGRIEDILPNPKGSDMVTSDEDCLNFLKTDSYTSPQVANDKPNLNSEAPKPS